MRKYLPIAVLLAGFTGVALAQQGQEQEELPSFEEVDVNRDGMISRAEAAAVEGLDFSTADTNQDGSIDRSEYQSAQSEN